MKILFLLTQDLESPAGVGRYFPWARGLVQLGHQVSIATLHANYSSLKVRDFSRDGVYVHYIAQMHVLKQNNQKIYFPAHKLIQVSTRATIELIKAAWSSKADIIQLGKPHPMNGIAGLIARYMKSKLVFLDCDDFEMANIHFGANWQKIGVRYFESLLPKRVDLVTVHTTYLQNMILKSGVDLKRVIYFPHGADRHRFSQIDKTKVEEIRANTGLIGKKVIVYIGSLSMPSHPIDILLDAFLQVRTANPQAILLIVGGGEEYERLVARVRWLGLDQSVIFIGRVPGAEVPNYYSLADIAVEPVIDNAVGRSSLPLKMFESWAAGVPFITQDVGDRRMVMGDPPAGLIAQAGDPNSLAEAIIRILADPEMAISLRNLGFQQAEKYSWENLSKKIEAVYQDVLAISYGKSR